MDEEKRGLQLQIKPYICKNNIAKWGKNFAIFVVVSTKTNRTTELCNQKKRLKYTTGTSCIHSCSILQYVDVILLLIHVFSSNASNVQKNDNGRISDLNRLIDYC